MVAFSNAIKPTPENPMGALPKLESLNLWNNSIGDVGLADLGGALRLVALAHPARFVHDADRDKSNRWAPRPGPRGNNDARSRWPPTRGRRRAQRSRTAVSAGMLRANEHMLQPPNALPALANENRRNGSGSTHLWLQTLEPPPGPRCWTQSHGAGGGGGGGGRHPGRSPETTHAGFEDPPSGEVLSQHCRLLGPFHDHALHWGSAKHASQQPAAWSTCTIRISLPL